MVMRPATLSLNPPVVTSQVAEVADCLHLQQADFSSGSSAAPEPQSGGAGATPPDWSSFGAPAPPQLQMQPYSSGAAAQPQPQQQQQQMPPWGAPLQLEAPPTQLASQGEGAPASGADWFDFGGGPPAGASAAAGGSSSSSTALVPIGGMWRVCSQLLSSATHARQAVIFRCCNMFDTA